MGWFADALERLRPASAPLLNIAGDVGDGPPIVLLHGIASSATTYQHLVPLLVDHYRCISIDLLGFGASPAPEDSEFTIEEHVASIESTVRSLQFEAPFHLVGHSLGALLAARYAARHPKNVARLTLVSPPVYLASGEIGDPRSRQKVENFLKLYEFLRANKDLTIGAAPHIARLFGVGDMLEVSERNWRAFVLSLQNCIESQTTVSDIAAVQVPIDLVYGTFDQFIAPGTLNIIEQMRHVTTHRVELGDHVMRNRLAKAVAKAIG